MIGTFFLLSKLLLLPKSSKIRNKLKDKGLLSGRIEPTKRIQRIVTIETQWSWISWIFLLLLFVLPDMYTAILICVITLIETWVVYELYNAREYAKKINEK